MPRSCPGGLAWSVRTTARTLEQLGYEITAGSRDVLTACPVCGTHILSQVRHGAAAVARHRRSRPSSARTRPQYTKHPEPTSPVPAPSRRASGPNLFRRENRVILRHDELLDAGATTSAATGRGTNHTIIRRMSSREEEARVRCRFASRGYHSESSTRSTAARVSADHAPRMCRSASAWHSSGESRPVSSTSRGTVSGSAVARTRSCRSPVRFPAG